MWSNLEKVSCCIFGMTLVSRIKSCARWSDPSKKVVVSVAWSISNEHCLCAVVIISQELRAQMISKQGLLSISIRFLKNLRIRFQGVLGPIQL